MLLKTNGRLIAAMVVVFGAAWGSRAAQPADPLTAANSQSQPALEGSARLQSAYAGSEACERCHTQEYAIWKRSLHVQMTKPIAEARVAGDFRPGSRLEANGRAYTMEARDGRRFIAVSHRGRAAEQFEVHYTLGARRYQGYLSKLSDGRIYVLPVFWHIETGRWVDFKEITPIPDSEHDIRQIWNISCFNCHATNLAQNFDSASRTYRTSWSEMGVGCEACHGPGQAHIDLMKTWDANPSARPAYDNRSSNRGLSETLKIFSPRSASKREVFDTCAYCHGNKTNFFVGFTAGDRYEDYAIPFLISQPIPDNDPQGDFWPDGRPSRFNRPQALTLTGCFKSGQLTCTSCHAAHGSKNDPSLKVPIEQSNLLCIQCHKTVGSRQQAAGSAPVGRSFSSAEPRSVTDVGRSFSSAEPRSATDVGRSFSSAEPRSATDVGRSFSSGEPRSGTDAARSFSSANPAAQISLEGATLSEHTHHPPDSRGSRCIECHMSEVNWRLLNRRRDHTFAAPVPEMTARYGAPNACTTCHDTRTPEWAAAVMDRWYGDAPRRRETLRVADAMYRAGAGDRAALPELARLAVNRDNGALVRASAAEFMGRLIAGTPGTTGTDGAPAQTALVNALIGAASDLEPMVRAAAVRALGRIGDRRALTPLAARLIDPARVARASAAEALLNLGFVQLDGAAGVALARAQEEYAASLRTFQDNASNHALLGILELSRGRSEEADRAFALAQALNPADPRPLVFRGVMAARSGDLAAALKAWRAAREIDPKYPNVEKLIREAEIRLGRQ